MQEFDLVVIGAGPGGYTAAIRAAQLGMKVACIEKQATLGGTCLNVGCIPSKALLEFSGKYQDAIQNFTDIGIVTNGVHLNLSQMLAKKDKIVGDLCKGIESLFAKNKITRFIGIGKVLDACNVGIYSINDQHAGGDDNPNHGMIQTLRAKNILIATGSEVINIPGIDIDERYIVSSTGALALPVIPKELLVIGGGYIGLELGSVWNRLGSKVTVIEYADRIVPTLDHEIGTLFHKILQNQGMSFMLGAKVIKASQQIADYDSQDLQNQHGIHPSTDVNKRVILTVEQIALAKHVEISCDVVLVAVGRKPHTSGLGLEKVNIKLDAQGRIAVNTKFQTSIASIYAIGDVISGPMLAHKAEEEAIAAVENMNNQAGHVNYDLIPGVIYTHPEVASVGKTEEELKTQGIDYKVGKFPFAANSRARSIDQTEGIVKILACAKTDRVLGAHIIGHEAGTLIAEVIGYMEFGGAAEDIARTCHAHPTLNEAIKEAALAIAKRAINL